MKEYGDSPAQEDVEPLNLADFLSKPYRHKFHGIDTKKLWLYDLSINNQLQGKRMISQFDSVRYA
jgi:hypothetical protein